MNGGRRYEGSHSCVVSDYSMMSAPLITIVSHMTFYIFSKQFIMLDEYNTKFKPTNNAVDILGHIVIR